MVTTTITLTDELHMWAKMQAVKERIPLADVIRQGLYLYKDAIEEKERLEQEIAEKEGK